MFHVSIGYLFSLAFSLYILKPPRNGRIVIINGRRFFSLNSQRDVHVPPILNFKQGLECDYFGEKPKLADFMEPRWIHQEFAFLCVLPLNPTFRAPLFNVLHAFKIEKSTCNTYQLDARAMEDWVHLETNLQFILGRLGHLCNGYVVPFIRLPSSFGYTRIHKSERLARRQAILSRDWFVILIGAVSYLLRSAGINTVSYWYKSLAEEVPEAWLSSLQASDAYVKGIKRVGAFMIFGDQTRDYPEYPFLLDLNIPIWYPWEDREVEMVATAHPGRWRVDMVPSPEQLANPTIVNWCDGIPPTFAPPPLVSEVQQPNLYDMPGHPETLPNPLSGQKPGQTWQEFFEARKLLQKGCVESDQQWREREWREQNPKKSGAAVYEWLPDSNGQWVRHPTRKQNFHLLYDYYSEKDGRFDAARNEWDFCSAFSGEVKPDDDDDDDDDNDGNGDDGDWWYPSGAQSEPQPSFLVSTTTSPIDELSILHFDLAKLLQLRYGFISPVVHSNPPIPESRGEEWNKTMLCVGHMGLKGTGNKLLDDAIVEFISSVVGIGIGGGGGVRAPLQVSNEHHKGSGSRNNGSASALRGTPDLHRHQADLWDLHPHNHLSFLNQMRTHVTPYHITWGPPDRREDCFLLPNGHDHPWSIALKSSTDILHVLCLNCSGPREIAQSCLSLGLPFFTFIRLSGGWRPRIQKSRWDCHHIPFTMEIPFRREGYIFTSADYAIHEIHRTRILSQPHGLSALKYGGIVWRLSKGFLGIEEVLLGPSDTSKEYGFGLLDNDPSSPGNKLCDDMLSKNELDLICGLHSSATGKRAIYAVYGH